ncbi:uncharacterized protein LOC106062345 isoform X1 [Biomphalaria glabrata]|uniref:Uncharacterized protein LOC106062345 isoform X1 n=1 Tax=Biomphalaria glabrata TaxID=6526 RepID=A0A9W2Z0U2_BIOGL|nr:uncharacterized protein LOC106062345 isoform X1 [Biomphalaria glabrata]
MNIYQTVAAFSIMYVNWIVEVLPMEMLVDPQTIEPGITEHLLINCSISKSSDSKLAFLYSITISRTADNESETSFEVASVNIFTKEVTQNNTEVEGAVSVGQLNKNGESFLSLQFMYPVQRMVGIYKCEAHGMSPSGKPATENSFKNVKMRNLDFTSVAEQLKLIKIQSAKTISEINERIIKQASEFQKEKGLKDVALDGLRNELVVKNQEILDLKQVLGELNTTTVNFIKALNARLESSSQWFFKVSPVYKGRRYYLSQQDPVVRSEEAMATCVFYGGYLAEIDDMEEHAFVVTFIKQFSGFNHVLLGGTDEGHEGLWLYRNSNSTLPSWAITQRQGTLYNCQYLYKGDNWAALDSHCYLNLSPFPARFLCEIPKTVI